jgi:hypothetical protein
MKVRPDSVVAFKEEYFQGKPALAKFVVTRQVINKQNVIGVHAKHFKEVCKVLKLPISKLKSSRTPYRGVYMATMEESPVLKVKDKKQAMRQKYMEITSGPRLERMEHLKHIIHDQEMRIRAVQIDLVKRLRDLEEKSKEYQLICADDQGTLENKGVEFDKLMANPDVVDISISGNYVNVLTGPIYIKHGDKVHDIGKFKIALAINPSQFIVKMHNLTRKIQGCDHPHIHDNGYPCLGNIQECLPQMVAARQFAAAISVCIQYLKSTNDGGHYAHINHWPLKKVREKRENVKK